MAKSKDKEFEEFKDYPKVIKQLRVVKDLEEEILTLKGDGKKIAEQYLSAEKQKLGYAKKVASETKKINKDLQDTNKSLTRLPKNVQKEIGTLKSGGGVFLDLTKEALELENRTLTAKGKKRKLTDEELAANRENSSFINGISQELLEQAKSTAEAENSLFSKSKLEKKIEEIELMRVELGDDLANKLIHAVHLTEELEHKEERLTELKEGQKELYEAAPDSLKSAIGFAQKLGKAMLTTAGPIVLIASLLAAGLESFLELDKASEDYSKTSGMTVKQTEHLAHQAHEIEVSLRGSGVELKHIFDVANDLANVFGDLTHFSTQTLAALGGIQSRTGVTSETAAKVQGVFEQVAGVSGETAANLQMQVASLAQQGKVSPKEVLEDIAENAEATSTFFKGDVTALKNQVIQAHQLGTTLTKVAATAEKLLDFENGIEDELVAATFVGGQFNLSTARGLAYAGKTVEAQEEILNQLNQGVGFKNQDIFAQKALAKAAGMTIEDINKQLLMKEKLHHLSGQDLKDAEAAISSGLDITNLNDEQLKQKTDEFIQGQKINGQVTEMGNMFAGIVATVGGALVPLFSAIGPILEVAMIPIQFMASLIGTIVSNMYILVPLVALLGIHFAAAAVKAGTLSIKSLQTAIGGIWESFSKIPLGIGIPLAIAATAGLVSMYNKVGDLKMPAGQGPIVTTAEGAIYQGTKNDDVAMAPGITSQLDDASKLGKAAGLPMAGGAFAGQAINILVNEMKQMRKDMASKSNDVYMDGSKVTANVASNSNNNTRNNFAFGQA